MDQMERDLIAQTAQLNMRGERISSMGTALR